MNTLQDFENYNFLTCGDSIVDKWAKILTRFEFVDYLNYVQDFPNRKKDNIIELVCGRYNTRCKDLLKLVALIDTKDDRIYEYVHKHNTNYIKFLEEKFNVKFGKTNKSIKEVLDKLL